MKYMKNGGKWDVWASQVNMVEAFIKEQKLVRLGSKTSAAYLLDESIEMATRSPERNVENLSKKDMKYWGRVKGIKGGMRVPHLHFRGDIYMLNDEQWKSFSGKMMDNLREKLNEASVISFEPMMELTQAIDTTMP